MRLPHLLQLGLHGFYATSQILVCQWYVAVCHMATPTIYCHTTARHQTFTQMNMGDRS